MIVPRTPHDPAAAARHYNALDVFYREIWGEHVHHGLWLTGRETSDQAVLNLVELIARRLGLVPGETVCDIGCGYGATSRLLADRYGCAVAGVTVSAAQLAWAQQNYPSANPSLRVMDWLANDFPAASFDAALSIESSEHMVDQQRFFDEISRTLKPDGRFATYAWLAAEAPSAASVKYLLEPICREGAMPQLGSESEYRAMMAAAGLTVVSFEDLTARVSRTWAICLRRAFGKILTDRRYRDFLFDSGNPDRTFALSLARILIAYGTGAMRYGLFVAKRD